MARPGLAAAFLVVAAAVLVVAPLRAGAHDGHGNGGAAMHAGARGGGWHGGSAAATHGAGHGPAQLARADWHGGAGRAVHADWHGEAPRLVRADWHGGFHGGHGPGFHGAYYGGRWEHGWHGGVFGWWYIDAGVWTPYPYYYPYYPYPAYPYGYAPPEAAIYNGNLPPPQQTWFYCDAAKGYYPNVQTCPGGWRPVTAAQAAPAAPANASPLATPVPPQ